MPQSLTLSYVPIEDVARHRGTTEAVAIRTAADDQLGTLDGLIVDAQDGRARYVVVDAGGILHRRHLLPVSLLRLDEPGGVLRVRVDKEVAERYPAFDSDAFATMSEAERGAYEARVLTFFPRDRERPPADEDAVAGLPEWLLNGTWITVPPECAERLPENERGFVNEFAPVPADDVASPPGCERMVAQDRDPAAAPQRDQPPIASHAEKLR